MCCGNLVSYSAFLVFFFKRKKFVERVVLTSVSVEDVYPDLGKRSVVSEVNHR